MQEREAEAAARARAIRTRRTEPTPMRVGWLIRRDRLRVLVCEPELIPIHPPFPSEVLNHDLLLTPTILWVQTLSRLTLQKGLDLRQGGSRSGAARAQNG
jgi:hypothetical protein